MSSPQRVVTHTSLGPMIIQDTKSMFQDLKTYKEPLLGPSVPLYWSKTPCKAEQPDPSMPYLVYKMRDHKVVHKNGVDKLYVLIHWQDYSEKDDTWEPVENFLPGYNLPWVR